VLKQRIKKNFLKTPTGCLIDNNALRLPCIGALGVTVGSASNCCEVSTIVEEIRADGEFAESDVVRAV
jgi:hypothetical protein